MIRRLLNRILNTPDPRPHVCYCEGRHEHWPYHTPTGCSTTIEGLRAAQGRYWNRVRGNVERDIAELEAALEGGESR